MAMGTKSISPIPFTLKPILCILSILVKISTLFEIADCPDEPTCRRAFR